MRVIRSVLLSAGLIAGVFVAPGHAVAEAAQCSSVPPEFAEILSRRWDAALNDGRARDLSELYAFDAVLITPASEATLASPPAVSAHLGKLASHFRAAPITVRTLRSGCNTILDFGDITLIARRNPQQQFTMRYSRLYERRGQHWQVTVDHLTWRDGMPTRHRDLPLGDDRAKLTAMISGLGQGKQPAVAGMLIRPPALAARPLAARAPSVRPKPRRSRRARVIRNRDWARKALGLDD